MAAGKRILKVPKEKQIRNLLQKEVAAFAAENRILPPASFETLERKAKELLGNLEMNEEYLDFTIVLLGNETWREVVNATPYHRRLLLLPQCLRNNLQCKGVFDELGLICAGCKGCQIDDILGKAEELGYSTLVAEGTTVAIGLVEEGSIDAVIGVSCMPVLQNSFAPVSRAAVPVIGLPLLFDGCTNTSIDYEWLFSEVEQRVENNELMPLSVSMIKNRVEEYFQEENLRSFFPGKTETEKLALKTMASGGQRMRPLLSVLGYQSYAENISEEIQSALAVIIECFHKASLIHDDIQDNEDFRYDQPALHRVTGIPVAINIGDYLIGKGYQLLANVPCDAGVKANCLKVVATSHINLSEGQGADILLTENISQKSVEDVLTIFEKKTGEAVKVALLAGAIAGNAPEVELNILSDFAEYFGIAYQIRDDLNELRETNELKHAFDFPFLLSLLNQSINGHSPTFPDILDTKDFGVLLENFKIYETEITADRYLGEYIQKCYKELDKLQNRKLRLSLYSVMGKVFKS
ncbi:MAG: polyprenyl synthetase family protein [Draconibacterium sp.]